ncbi:AhpA/YtjB family protein [Psychromonas sp. MME2]|uniref:AhpA/YtjB family protein n=1 Tax=unclassified Psychromonas TaxID=2614957 RepID=UPI00339BFACD
MHKKWFYLWRFIQITTLLAVCMIIGYQYYILQMTSNDIKSQQSEKFSYSLTNLAAAQATRYLANNKTEELQLLIEELSNDPTVRDITIYDHLGQIVSQSKQALPLSTLLDFDRKGVKEAEEKSPYIAELYKKNEKIGYIRITLEQQKILSVINHYQETGRSILIQLLICSFIVGGILMALFFKKLEAGHNLFIKEFNETKNKMKFSK